jgi:hypothetical protein
VPRSRFEPFNARTPHNETHGGSGTCRPKYGISEHCRHYLVAAARHLDAAPQPGAHPVPIQRLAAMLLLWPCEPPLAPCCASLRRIRRCAAAAARVVGSTRSVALAVGRRRRHAATSSRDVAEGRRPVAQERRVVGVAHSVALAHLPRVQAASQRRANDSSAHGIHQQCTMR